MLATRLPSLLLLVACGKGEPAPEQMPADPAAAAKAASATALTFAWPAPATVKVTEKALKNGKEVTMRYTLAITREPDGGLQVAYRDFEFVDLAGLDLKDPEIKKAMAPALALAAAIPPLEIAADGSLRDLGDLEPIVDQLADMGVKMGNMSPAQADQVRSTMKSPAVMDMLRARIAVIWQSWVSLWLHGPLPAPGQSRQLAGVNGTVLNLGAGQRGLRLAADVTTPRGAIENDLQLLLGQAMDDVAIEDMTPYSASYQTRVKLTADGASNEALERHQYQFVWQ
jgi:hypothetical protein